MVEKFNPKHISLRVRIVVILVALVFTTIAGGVATIWYADATSSLFTSVIGRDIPSLETAEDLETALAMQKGFTAYFFQDGNPDWLKQLDQYQQVFEEVLKKAREYARTEAAWGVLNKIESEYLLYKNTRKEVIQHFQKGEKESGLLLQRENRGQFLIIHDLCEQYKGIHKKNVIQAQEEGQLRTRYINTAALIAIQIVIMTSILLAYILFRQILGPIRRLTMETGPIDHQTPMPDEVRALSKQVHSLIEDVDQTQDKLARSQEHLVQSEKWAMTGKLAAGVAHSIRNPLTSVKIRLFSMGRAVESSPRLKEDLEVISDEIGHIESIVRSFLEFSRPPKLTKQKISPSEVVDMSLRLLGPRLESCGVKVDLIREKPLDEIWADPDQLKEVLVNLLVNACEMMVDGGIIRILEKEEEKGPTGPFVVISISDNGPGIPEAIQEKIFQPFFSTKEEGTGLGLSIASRIVEKHGGTLILKSEEGEGTTFTITLPYTES
ncbi:MAG: ATP-binding protein [Thermodesulfobacteriota bacterium]